MEEVEVYEYLDGKYKMTARGKNIIHHFNLSDCTADIDFKEIWV